MAQSAVDLPDPLNGGNLAGVANADDLLSQLAGDEIDRLLAESEGDPAPIPITAPPPIPAAAAQPPASASLDAVLAESASPAGGEADQAAVEEQAAPADFLAELEQGPIETTVSAEPTAPPEPVKLAKSVALRSPAASTKPSRPARVGLLIKPLVWINAPAANLPEPAREMIGKVAIVTLLNAVAVLAYVWMFVRHRH